MAKEAFPTTTRPFTLRLLLDEAEGPLEIVIPRALDAANVLDLGGAVVCGMFGEWKVDPSVTPEWKHETAR